MRRDEIETILNTDLANEEIEYLKMSFEISNEEIEEYKRKTSLFFEKINGKGISNLNIINVFIAAVQKSQEEGYDVNARGEIVTRKVLPFYEVLKECYIKYIVGYVDSVDIMLANEERAAELDTYKKQN